MVRKICPIVKSSDPISRTHVKHSLTRCIPKLSTKDVVREMKKRDIDNKADLIKEIRKSFAFIYGYCESENILFVNISKFTGTKTSDTSLTEFKCYKYPVDFIPSQTVEVMPANPPIVRIRIEPRNTFSYLSLRSLTCIECKTTTLRNIIFNTWKDTIRTAIVCLDCYMLYVFDGKDSFIPLISINLSKKDDVVRSVNYKNPVKISTESMKA